MAEAAVTYMLEQVKEVLAGYANLIGGAEEEFRNLTDDLSALKAHLKQMSEKEDKEPQEREIERRMRDAVYVVEDNIDICLTEAIKAKGKNVMVRIWGHLGASLAKEVKAIRLDMLQPLLVEAGQIAGKPGSVKAPRGGPEWPISVRRDIIPARQDRVIGFDGEEKTVTGFLMEPREELDVITIVGIPGQGKTTLASMVYHNETICHHFPIRIWIYISQVFNPNGVFLQILKKFRPSLDTSGVEYDELALIVRKCLEKERFLLVLDDVWSLDAWDTIKEVLPLHNGEGKVLITTRMQHVGNKSRVSHNLRFLNDKESWILLQYEVFGNLDVCPKHLEKIGRLVAAKCDGVPLTIVVIGQVLMDQYYKHPSKAASEWEIVSQSMSKALIDDAAKNNLILDVVRLSYNILTDELKECFVYLGVFPEDYEIPARMLCGLWISEGFVRPRDRRSMEECAEENMMNLISRNLLKVERRNHMGEVKTCRVHGMIRALCISVSKDENLCQEIKRSNLGKLRPSPSEVKNSRRLCFHSNDVPDFLSGRPSGQHVRSLLCFYERPDDLDKRYASSIPDCFKKLRILESKCIKFDTFPTKMAKLVHLRYLTLYIKTLPSIPAPVAQLWNLQSLVLETQSRFIIMKANIWIMVRLRHFKTRATLLFDNEWKGDAGQNLHTLHKLAVESCTQAIYTNAENLKNLGIFGKLSNFFETGFLEKLMKLEKLKLENSEIHEENRPRGLPLRNCFPPHLKRLTLTKTFLGWAHFSTLAKIHTLEVLKLKDNAFVGPYWAAAADSVHCLQHLLISDTDLVIWEANPQSFPCLRILQLRNCQNLNKIPEALIGTLEKLEISRLPESAVESARKIIDQKRLAPAPRIVFIMGS